MWPLMGQNTCLSLKLSTSYRQCKLPFGNPAPFAVWGLQKLERLIRLLSRSSVPHLNLIRNTCQDSLTHTHTTTVWFIRSRNLGPRKLSKLYSVPGAALSVQNGAGLRSPVRPVLTLARSVWSAGPGSEQGRRRDEGWVWPSGVSYADAWGGGWREESGGQIWSHRATATAGLTSFRCPKAALFL